jgi:alpha-beta hydrolase superfamily lysophospholipase
VRFYVHGAGKGGRAAWPEQTDVDAVFADHSTTARMRDKAGLVVEQAPGGAVIVVAHSLGAVPVALAHAAGRLPASHVVLVEPALYDIARGEDAVEAHIGPMTAARGLAERGDLFGYWQVVAPMMFGREATREAWDEDEDLARRFASMDPPWGHGVTASVFNDVPTMVATSGWNREYDAIAGRLVDAGATHVLLPGARHRPQDHPDFESVLVDFVGG